MEKKEPLIRRFETMEPEETHRPGLMVRKLLKGEESRLQNVVLMDADEGVVVELHEIEVSESFFILEGIFEVVLEEGGGRRLEPGDFCHFFPETCHGLQCVHGPGRFLIIFAPAR
jgi:quercetin dioxygenase-like cupin family protein